MESLLVKEIKKMEGYLVGFGIEKENIKKAISDNKKITTCFLLEEKGKGQGSKNNKLFNRTKKVNIKKIRKAFKKKKVDNVICNYNTIKPYLKTFVRDSVYINKNKLYIYNISNKEQLIEKYQRYTNNIEIKKDVIIIDNANAKNNKLKDILYWWKDTFSQIADILTTILVN